MIQQNVQRYGSAGELFATAELLVCWSSSEYAWLFTFISAVNQVDVMFSDETEISCQQLIASFAWRRAVYWRVLSETTLHHFVHLTPFLPSRRSLQSLHFLPKHSFLCQQSPLLRQFSRRLTVTNRPANKRQDFVCEKPKYCSADVSAAINVHVDSTLEWKTRSQCH